MLTASAEHERLARLDPQLRDPQFHAKLAQDARHVIVLAMLIPPVTSSTLCSRMAASIASRIICGSSRTMPQIAHAATEPASSATSMMLLEFGSGLAMAFERTARSRRRSRARQRAVAPKTSISAAPTLAATASCAASSVVPRERTTVPARQSLAHCAINRLATAGPFSVTCAPSSDCLISTGTTASAPGGSARRS